MSITKSGVAVHDNTCNAAEMTRQGAVAGATTQAAIRTAEVSFYRTCRTSAISNGLSPSQFVFALQELGVGGA